MRFSTSIRLVVLLVIGTVVSCKNEDRGPSYPSTLYITKVSNVSKIRVFTKNGEITNDQVAESFKKRFAFFDISETIVAPEPIVTFVSADTAKFANEDFQRFVVREDDRLLFYTPYLPVYSSDAKNNIARDFDKEGYPLGVSSPTSNQPDYMRRIIWPAKGDQKNLEFMVASYVQIRSDSLTNSYSNFYITGSMMEFDQSAVRLSNSDTLAILTYSYICRQ